MEFQVMRAIIQLRQAVLTALYRDTALVRPHYGRKPPYLVQVTRATPNPCIQTVGTYPRRQAVFQTDFRCPLDDLDISRQIDP